MNLIVKLTVYCIIVVLCTLCPPLDCSVTPLMLLNPSSKSQVAYFHKILEKSLLNDSSALYHLQQVFFPTDDHLNAAKIPFIVNIIVNYIEDTSSNHSTNSNFICSNDSSTVCKWTGIDIDWYPELSADLFSDDLRQYVLSVQDKLRELEYVSWVFLEQLGQFGSRDDHPTVTFTLTVPVLNILPSNKYAEEALLSIMAWVSCKIMTK